MPVSSVPPTFDLAAAARRVIEGSLRVASGERLVILCDRAREDLAQALAAAATAVGATAAQVILEDVAARPHAHARPEVLEALEGAQASVLVCSFHGGEFPMRAEIVAAAERLGLRHAHMIGITRKAMVMSLAVDPARVEARSLSVLSRMRPSSVLRVRSAAGTDLAVHLDERHRWLNHSGVVRPGAKENLPGGEIVTCPGDVNGVYVANGTLGDATGSFAGSLTKTSLVLHVEEGVVKRVEGSDTTLARRIQVAMRGVPNLDRVALVSLGTNEGLREPVGEIFVDQTQPSFHLSLGLTFPDRTGASWTCERWIAFTATGSDVEIDGTPLMRGGKYLYE